MDMTNRTAVARTARYMTHLVEVDETGAPVRLLCQPLRALPKHTEVIDSEVVNCNRCTGANRTSAFPR
jgi:hypothetical protein